LFDDFDWAEPIPGPLPVDARIHGDEWLDCLIHRLTATTGSTEFRMRSEEAFGHLWTPHGGTITSSLLVSRSIDHQIVCQVLGHGERREHEVQPWIEAVAYAEARLGAVATFCWYAVIGEDPDSPISPPMQLAGTPTIGGIELVPAQRPFMEIRTGRSLSQGQTSRTFLMCARGASEGYAPQVAMREAARDIKILCSLLSLASGRTWVQRKAPQPVAAGETAIDPSTLPEYPFTYPDYLKGEDNYADPTIFTLPTWIEAAWTNLQQDPQLARLVGAYHENLLLDSGNHDSYALLASVAVIEAIGNRAVGKLPRCEMCGLTTGSSARFRAALERVMAKDDAAALGKVVYGHRSKTAHDGVLHGTELTHGSHPVQLLSEDPPTQFEYAARMLRIAVAHLLQMELGAPPREKKLSSADGPRGVIAMARTTTVPRA
jgi:hypothetical protein